MMKPGLRPSRPLAVAMTVAAAAILVFGLVTLVRAGLPPFGFLWLAVAAGLVGFLAWRLLRRSR